MDDSVTTGSRRPTKTPARETAEELCALFIDALPITGASISVFDESGHQSSIGASDETAARLEELQFELGEGPHWEVLRTAEPVLIPDLLEADTSRWPMFSVAAREVDARALFALPLVMGAVTVGVVGLYRSSPGKLGERGLATAFSLMVATAAPAVQLAVRSAGDDVAMESMAAPALRREVHQATGMILVQLETTATEAFSRLKAHAFSSGRTVQDVAHDVVGRQLDLSRLAE